jgi:hypothetical protein
MGCLGMAWHTLSTAQQWGYPSVKKRNEALLFFRVARSSDPDNGSARVRSSRRRDRERGNRASASLPGRQLPTPATAGYRSNARAWPEPGGAWRGGSLSELSPPSCILATSHLSVSGDQLPLPGSLSLLKQRYCCLLNAEAFAPKSLTLTVGCCSISPQISSILQLM